MGILLYGLAAFILAFLIHVVIWKIRVPKANQTVVLLEVFLGVLIAAILVFHMALADLLGFMLLYGSLTLAYITSYSAVEVDSPSLTMVLNIAKEMPGGLPQEKFMSMMTNELLVMPRLNDLVLDGMVRLEKGKYQVTAKGRVLTEGILFFRKLLNTGEKGG